MPVSSQTVSIDQKLKIGLVVNTNVAPKNLFELVQWCQAQSSLCISHLLVMDTSFAKRHTMAESLRSLCLSTIKRIETKLLKKTGFESPATCHKLDSIIPETIRLQTSADQSGRISICSPAELEKIKELKLDILLMIGSGTLQGDILNTSALGVVSALHNDENIICGVQAGFWDVFLKQDFTEFAILLQSNANCAGNILLSGRMRTQNYYLLNHIHLQQKYLHYLKRSLISIAQNRQKPPCLGFIEPNRERKRGLPNLFIQAKYIYALGLRLLKRAVRRIRGKDYKWNVAYKKNDWISLPMQRAVKIPNPKNHFLADPFVISESGRDYCFLEDYDYSKQIGHIAVYELHDDHAECLGNALVEPYHLSFPYLFRYKSELYMCPETSRNRQIRVYKCVQYPLQWQLHTVLMDDVSAADTMLFELDGRWWMLTNMDVTETGDYCTELNIYWADSPLSSQWTAHQANPIFIDAAKGRNAGLLFDASHIYRVSQKQSFDFYGKQFSINRIDQLDETAYRESEVRTVQADFFPNTFGTHHMHSNGAVTVFDFLQLNKI